MPVVPMVKPGPSAPPPVDPTFLDMAAAQMHREGKFKQEAPDVSQKRP